MIDTIAFITRRRLREETYFPDHFEKNGFTRLGRERLKSFKFTPHAHTIWSNKHTGLRISTDGQMLRRVEVSLPRLHQNDGWLPTTQAELDSCLDKLKSELCAYSEEPSPGEEDRLQRIDLCLQFPIKPRMLWLAHRNLYITGIQKGPFHYDLCNLTFRGKNLEFCIYDKIRQLTGQLPSQERPVCRVELRLKNADIIARYFGSRLTGIQLDFSACYQVYRKFLTSLGGPRPVLNAKPTINELLAILEAEGVTLKTTDCSPLDWYLKDKTKKIQRTIRKQVGKLVMEYQRQMMQDSFDWAKILPEDYPPEISLIQPTAESRTEPDKDDSGIDDIIEELEE
ncbi:hypothetical protein OpiT1DRAFT_00020 [Opitutaceae bacterium TAV1]|nr:hypothetical protein OpiT1DRAFT_00020 [Opitutaceae bacterium TAV1]